MTQKTYGCLDRQGKTTELFHQSRYMGLYGVVRRICLAKKAVVLSIGQKSRAVYML